MDVGSYHKGGLVKDWNYGVILEKDLNGDGIPDYVWYGGDDTGQRLLWFLSKDDQYECINLLKTAESAWKKRFGKAAPDLGEVGGESEVKSVAWDGQAQLLTVSVEAQRWDSRISHKVKLYVAPAEFVNGTR